MSGPIFGPFEAAVDNFLRAGGHKPTAIRSPREVMKAFKASFPGETGRDIKYFDAPVEVADGQDFVSVRGTTLAGQQFEWPEP
jgi:hypothetical protein